MATLTGKITDVTGRAPDSISSITVKAPSARIGSGADVIVSSPAEVTFDKTTGDITISGLTGGLSWLYIEGDGWSDSIALAVAEGMITLVEAMANASGLPGMVDYVRLLGEIDIRVDGIAQGAVDAAAAAIKWARPQLTTTSVLNSLSPGLYPVSSASVATALGLPGDTVGYLTVIWVDPGGVYRRFVWETDTGNAHFEWRATYWNGDRGAWYRPLSEALETTWKGVDLTVDSPVDALPAPGRYNSKTGTISTALGLPGNTIGVLDETWVGSSNYRRQDWKIDPSTGHRHYRRRAYLGDWQPWVLIAEEKTIPQVEELESRVTTLETATPPEGGDGSEQDSWALTRVVREADMRRRVGRVSVPGGAVTLIFDHGTTKFRDIVWPALQARGLSATLALCHDVHVQEPRPTTGFDTATVAQIKSWVAGGLDIANHSATHNGATGWAAMHAEIIGAQKSLETTLGTTVDNWVQPGYPWDHPDFDGFSRGYTSSAYRDTVAGRMIVGHHVAISGKIGAQTDLYELDGHPPIGFQRVNIDNLANMAEADSQIQAAIAERKRVAVLCHPYLIAANDSTSETSTKESDFLAFLDRLVAERDAGRLSVLTLSQWAVAERG